MSVEFHAAIFRNPFNVAFIYVNDTEQKVWQASTEYDTCNINGSVTLDSGRL